MGRKKPGFISLGAVALIAGCGGGGGASGPARIEPPTSAGTGPMAAATLRLQIPARGAAAARRRPQWMSPSSTTLGVRVLTSPLPNPTPTEQVFTLPTPGPVPTSMTLQVQAPISTDTFVVSAYDTNHEMLATGSSAPIAVGIATTPPVAITMLGVASGVQLTAAGSTPATWRVLENVNAPQTTSISAQPVDADGNLIPGTLATPATLSATDGVTLSATTITAATTVTATYPSNTGGSGSITSPLTLNAGSSPLNVTVAGDYYVYVDDSDGTVYAIDALTQKQVGSVLTGPSGSQIAVLSGCATGAFAVSGNSSNAYVYSVAIPSTANPTPAPAASPLPAAILSANPFWYGVAADSHCDAFYNNANSGNPVVKLNGFDTTIAASPSFATGFTQEVPLKTIGTQLYSATAPTLGDMAAFYVSETTGGAASTSASYGSGNVVPNEIYIAGAGSTVFLVGNTCSGQPLLQALSGGSLITLSQFETVAGAAQSTDGTVYLAGLSEATGNAPTLAYGALGSVASAPTINLGGTPVDVAVTPDQQYVCVLESPSGSNGQIEFYRRLPSPSLVATVPLSSSASPTSLSIGP
jgi:hypothetical protein